MTAWESYPRVEAQIASETQKLATDALVHLYTLDTTTMTPAGTDVLFWTPSVIHAPPNVARRIVFQGVTYEPYPIEAEGFEWRGKGPVPRPRIRISNIENLAGSVVVAGGDLVGAKVTRLRTFARFLDGEPGADPGAYVEPDIWFVERKASHNPVSIEWELTSSIDQQGRFLPGRQCLRDTCTQIYRQWNPATGAFDYTGVTCPYTAGAYWTQNGTPTGDASLDSCGQRLSDCKLRGDASGWASLPSWAFPGLGRVR